jgi:chaperonin GroES
MSAKQWNGRPTCVWLPTLEFEGGNSMAVALRPLGDRVVIKPLAREDVTKGGIVLPDTATEKPQQGEVVAVGPGRILDSGDRVVLDVKTGDRVLFAKYAGTEFKHEDDELLILSEKDVLAVLVNGK